jgi:hypothetical protein
MNLAYKCVLPSKIVLVGATAVSTVTWVLAVNSQARRLCHVPEQQFRLLSNVFKQMLLPAEPYMVGDPRFTPLSYSGREEYRD